jgi:uncharacterized protein
MTARCSVGAKFESVFLGRNQTCVKAVPLSLPDCLRCGVCCYSASDRFVRVTGADWTRLGAAAERVAHFTGRGNEAYMRMAEGHCAALVVRSAQGGPEFFCTIYEHRPQICRDLARGSPECEGERALKAAAITTPCAPMRPPLSSATSPDRTFSSLAFGARSSCL